MFTSHPAKSHTVDFTHWFLYYLYQCEEAFPVRTFEYELAKLNTRYTNAIFFIFPQIPKTWQRGTCLKAGSTFISTSEKSALKYYDIAVTGDE